MTQRRTISASSLSTFLSCGYRYWLRYGGKKPVREQGNEHTIAGHAFHAGVEYAFASVLAGKEPSIDECVGKALSTAQDEFKAGGMYLDPTTAAFSSPTEEFSRVLARVKRAVAWYLERHFDRFRPAQEEYAFKVDIPDTDGWKLNGRIDLVEQDGAVVDFKLSGSQRQVPTDKADRSLQLSIYALARYLETGDIPPMLKLEYCRDGGKRMSAVSRATQRSEVDVKRTLLLVQHAVEMIERKSFVPANPEHPNFFGCNGHCQFWKTCAFGYGDLSCE